MMKPFLYYFFHTETVDRSEKGMVRVPENSDDWPEEWKTVVYKRYSLFPKISLPLSDGIGMPFREVLVKRRSSRKHFGHNILTVPALSHVLKCGCGLQDTSPGARQHNRMAPSGGQRYPLEVYVFLFKPVGWIQPGVYHYGIREHVLEPVIVRDFSRDDIVRISPQKNLRTSSAMICMTAVFSRTTNKYGSRGYRYILIEAGHIGQNMLLAGTEYGINILPIGGTNELAIENTIGLSSLKERAVYTLFV